MKLNAKHRFCHCHNKKNVPTGTGTKFGAYLSLSPTLNDNILLEKLSNFTLNANYIWSCTLWSSQSRG